MTLRELIDGVREGNEAAGEELYLEFHRRYFGFIKSRLNKNIDRAKHADVLHDAFIHLLSSIQGRRIRNPEALWIFSMSIVQRGIHQAIRNRYRAIARGEVPMDETQIHLVRSRDMTPEENVQRIEKLRIADELIASLSKRDHSLIERFYKLEQTAPRIQRVMKMSSTIFRLRKSRVLGIMRLKLIERQAQVDLLRKRAA